MSTSPSTSTFMLQIPAKLILFGEWAVLDPQHTGVGIPLKTFFNVHLQKKENSNGFAFEDQTVDSTQTTKESYTFLNQCIDALSIHFNTDLRLLWSDKTLKLNRNWKLSEGLGSSSALFLGLYQIARASVKRNPHKTNEELWHTSLPILKSLQNGKGSGLDLAIQIHQQPTLLKQNQPRSFLFKHWPSHLHIIHTGNKVSTTNALAQQELKACAISKIASSTSAWLQSPMKQADWQVAIQEHNEALKDLGVFPDFVKEFEHDLKDLILGLKTTGAGGGDALLVLLNPNASMETFHKAVLKRQWWMCPYQPILEASLL